MKSLSLFIIAFCFSLQLFATAQKGDILVYKSDTMFIFANPLEELNSIDSIRPKLFGDNKSCFSTACWRGYVAEWTIIDNQLYLTAIFNCCHYDNKIQASFSSGNLDGNIQADLKELFGGKCIDGKVMASWVTSNIIAPQGKLLYYIHNGYESLYETELELQFQEGKLIGTKTYDNSKSKQSIYKDKKLLDWIENSINWDNLPEDWDYITKARVILHFSANEYGIIDDVEVVRGIGDAFDKEAVRVVKTIPEWDIYYKHGKHERKYWTLPINFGKMKKKMDTKEK